ncbi:hypothetical protein [Salinibaculum rarum]|uniref:hypothetical protein n=1 Tax=Salinibaculum rarum TaxID=3058903 RepID=UPI00265FD836|nr:hypothetical protein [Salinibaculum sp. KK48]
MTESYNLPLVGGARALTTSAMMPATDAHMRQPAESDPRLHQLLPKTTDVEPPYTVAGLHADSASLAERYEEHPAGRGRTVTALYTPDGTCAYQKRSLACRITYFDDDHPYSDDIDGYHDQKLNEASVDSDRAAYTDWIDSTYTRDEVNGLTRTVFSSRKPILIAQTSGQRNATRPVLVTAIVVQSTSWGVIEIGTHQWPDPDPGVARESVITLAGTLTHRADRLPRPTPDSQWPLFYGHDLSQAELATAMQTSIAELTDEPSELKNEPGAVLATLLDRFQAEYDVAPREARKILTVLDQRGDINDSSAGLIKLT